MTRHPVRSPAVAAFAMLIAIVAAIVLIPNKVPSAATVPAPGSVSDTNPLTMGAQSQLDQLFGAGHSRIVASAAYTNASGTVTQSYSSRGSAPLAAANATGPGYSASSVQNGVGQTLTQRNSPGGAITHLSVAVVVDASKHPNLRAVRRTVSAAMGLNTARGDRLSVVSAPMATPATASATTPTWPGRVASYLPSGTAVIIALICAVVAVTSRRAAKRPS